MKYIYVLIVIISLLSCKPQRQQHVLATIDGEEITSESIGKAIEPQLYDCLYEIYKLRKTATEVVISRMVLEREAAQIGISADSFLNSYIGRRTTSADILQYAEREHLIRGIPYVEDGIYHYTSYDSPKGQTELLKTLKQQLQKQLIDSLKEKYNVSITIKPPVSPRLNLDSLMYFERGNLQSPIKFTEITDYNCSVCRSMHVALEQLFEDYSDKVCFRYSSIIDEGSIALRAVLAASEQDKEWQMRDALMREQYFVDSAMVFRVAMNLDLDMDAFSADFSSEEVKNAIALNNEYLHRKGIYSTPTFLINNHLLHDATDVSVLRSELERAISEK